MTEGTDNEQKPCPHSAKLQEKLVQKEIEPLNEAGKRAPETGLINTENLVATEKELELTKTIIEEAFKKVETLSQENAQLRKRLKLIEKVYNKFDYLDGYMEKYGAPSDFELEMWQAIRQVIKG